MDITGILHPIAMFPPAIDVWTGEPNAGAAHFTNRHHAPLSVALVPTQIRAAIYIGDLALLHDLPGWVGDENITYACNKLMVVASAIDIYALDNLLKLHTAVLGPSERGATACGVMEVDEVGVPSPT